MKAYRLRLGQQRGRFTVDQRFFVELDIGDGVNLFVGMVVLDVRHDWLRGTVEYFAIHEHFRRLKEGEIIPEYEAIFHAGSSVPVWREKCSSTLTEKP